jgi:DNA-binding response OmpR family regulator
MRLLLVEDDASLGKAICIGLEQDGYAVDWIRDGEAAEVALSTHTYTAIVLDLGLPKLDGMTVLRRARKRGHNSPIIVLTARDDTPERIMALDMGADDFIIKPVDLNELSARLRATIRRSNGRASDTIAVGPLTIEPSSRRVTLHGEEAELTGREFALLMRLAQSPDLVVTREQLEESLYGWGDEIVSNAIQVHISKIRGKLGKDLVETCWGTGYRLSVNPSGSREE